MIDDVLSRFDFTPDTGLVWVTKSQEAANYTELLAINEAKRFKADAVYFRRFENSNHSVPQVYIYDRAFSDDELLETHTNLWSSGVVPLFYVATSTEVKIYNCSKSLEGKGKKNLRLDPIQIFSLIGDIQQKIEAEKFSAKLFDNGTFWEEHPEILKVSESPYQKLLNGLLNAKKNLEQQQELHLSPSTISKLLIIGVLVKYLEDKEDKNGTNLLEISRDFYQQFPDCKQFTDILRNGYINAFLEELNIKFNGKVFDLKPEEKQELGKANLSYVAAVFDADIEGHQYVLWKLYAFNFLPIELISGIYEAFLKKEKGVVYTPPYLVNLLIDECMPLDKAEEMFSTGTFKVLDPACGSGIFLVAALKRMVQWQAILNYKATESIDYPNIETIKRIVRDNIFGVDIEEGATFISIFSLCIAICDKLSPMQIWNELRFDDLGEENIVTDNFFGVFDQLKAQGFDLVIGNPPFNPPSGFSKLGYFDLIQKNFSITPNLLISGGQLALFFLDKAVELRRSGGKICFILPANSWLYNSKATPYRTFFMENYRVEKIFDFTHLSDRLFHGSATPAVCATIATDLQPKERLGKVLHIIIKRSKVAEERFYFEIDHYDVHQIKYKIALDNSLVWKCNLFSGGRLIQLISYLSGLRSLDEFLFKMKNEKNWVYGEGYKANDYAVASEKNTYVEAEWITDKQTVEKLDESGMTITIEQRKYFSRPRSTKKNIFKPPHILIKESLGKNKIPMAFSEEYLCFNDRIFGIHAPLDQRNELFRLYESFLRSSSLNRLYALTTSGESGVTKSPFVLDGIDILKIPYPENPEDIQLGYSEKIIQDDVLNYYIKSSSNSEKSPLNYSTTESHLHAFGEVFCNTLNPIYEQNGMKWFSLGFQFDQTTVMHVFCFGKPQQGILPEIFEGGLAGIEKLLYNTTRRNIRISRVLREYLHIEGYDVLILIKPRALRYWLRSIALRDADETFADLKISGF
ncbi:HsdM family class I SAM-dependent methyltransferase [Haliscomenobacter hydrossis]|uniref:site-specific DNA-methyltransferase (adenine-specific) n=1 Tax=Haliscomenobacter hydrossis (strain ATCC 27775 / DSM 1100 / LMG 10767 / O) TaxID=760192 RepID=F4KT03_HALH1|nr:N-6 DNA methylase [Haliscomenobacter hydrossis]AEE50073.1 hypothetical protein Halhy_2190 [Haliscomenobacter hydrossis DSM 1100]